MLAPEQEPTSEASAPSSGKIPFTGLPTENPNSTIIPGKMRSDREEIPGGYTKEQADQAEVSEAQLIAKQRTSRAAVVCQQYWPTTFNVCGEIRDKYNSLGGSGSFLFLPTSDNIINPGNTGERVTFVNGPIYWSAAGGAHPVVNSFLNRWGINNYETGRLLYPTTDEIVLPDGGRRQEFQQGAIYVAFQNAVGSAILNGPLRDKYNSLGGLAPGGTLLGYIIQDQIAPLPDGQGQMARFQNGVIYWSPATGAHWINGRLLDIWSRAGYERGEYGYPTSDTVPRSGEPGSAEQSFASGNMYSAADQRFMGLVVPVSSSAGPSFTSYDTGEHPSYDLAPNLSEYDTVPDPDGTATQSNLQIAAATAAYFSDQGLANSRDLFDHYYGNGGLGYGADPNYLFRCLRSETQNYPGNLLPTLAVASTNQSEAVQLAFQEAQRTNRTVKLILSGPWNRSVASSDRDCTLGIGRFTMSSTTAVIASPGATGQRTWTARQAGHLQDVYDYANGSDEYPTLQQSAVNNAHSGTLLGIAKPFLVYGDSVDYYSQGVG